MATLTGEVDDEPDTSGSSYSNDFSDGTMGVNELDGNGWWSSTICPGRTIVLEQSFFKVVRASMISSPCTFNLAYPPPKHLICWRKAWRIRDETMVFFVRTTLIQLGWEDKKYEKRERYGEYKSHVRYREVWQFYSDMSASCIKINYVRSYLESNAFNIAANAILDGRTLWHNSELYTANSSWYLATSNTLHPLPTLLSLWVGG